MTTLQLQDGSPADAGRPGDAGSPGHAGSPAVARPGRGAATRAWAAAGIVGALLVSVGLSALGDTPDPHDAAPALAAYFVGHRASVFASAALVAIGSVGVLAFLAALGQRIRRAGAPVGATVAFVGGGAVLGLLALNELVYATLAYQVAAETPTTAKALFAFTIVAATLQGPWCAVLVVTVSIAALRHRVLPRWFAGIGLVAGAAVLPATVAFDQTGFFYPDVQQQIVVQVFLLWVLAAAVVVVCRPLPRPVRRPTGLLL